MFHGHGFAVSRSKCTWKLYWLDIALKLLWKARFDAVIISAEVGYEKPAQEIFEAALSKYFYGTFVNCRRPYCILLCCCFCKKYVFVEFCVRESQCTKRNLGWAVRKNLCIWPWSQVSWDDCQQLHYVFIPDQLGAEAMDAVHVGDDLVNDKQGANRAGIDAW